jgi:hypothetical protein
LITPLFFSFPVHGEESVYRVKRSGEAAPEAPRPEEPPVTSGGETTSPANPIIPEQAEQLPPEAAQLVIWNQSSPKQVRRYERVVEPNQYLDHSVLGQVLKKYVTKNGWVNYRGLLRDKWARRDLEAYVSELSAMDPSTLTDPLDKLAAWLNIYNSMIILEILKYYPIQNLMQIPDFYGKPRFHIGQKDYSLLEIEQEIFQKNLHEPRAILARVNGSSSGPRLLREPFKATLIDQQLDERTFKFLTDPDNMSFDPKSQVLKLNPTFLWYQDEFGDLLGFLRSYLDLLPKYFIVSYRGYDWKLNDEKLH